MMVINVKGSRCFLFYPFSVMKHPNILYSWMLHCSLHLNRGFFLFVQRAVEVKQNLSILITDKTTLGILHTQILPVD